MLEPGIRFCPHDGTPLTETSGVSTVRTPTGAQPERPPSREIELPAVVGGRYRLTDVRGGGGMAKVYRAVDTTLEREVAVKLINPELRAEPEFDQRFQREARIASQLADPHIVVVHDFGIDPAHGPFLVMEFLQGQSLRERLAASGPLPLKAGLQLSAQLLLALIHAHGKNIVHRDIKPDNIFLLNQSGVRLHVRVLDFGIARIYRRDEPGRAETLTNPGAVLGTPRYMSPEQLAGRPVDARSDVYSAALVIHEALTGQLPYVSGQTLCELCPEASATLQELLDQCLKPNPMERPPSAVEVYLRLQELGKASGILLLPPGALDKLVAARHAGEPTVAYQPAPPRGPWRRRLLIGAGVLAVLAALVAAYFLFVRTHGEPGEDETLMGVKVGDDEQEVVERLKLTSERVGNPWEHKRAAALVGHVLRPADLGLEDDALAQVKVRWTRDDRVCALFHDEKLRALVARKHGAATGHGVKVHGDAGELFHRYKDCPPTEVKPDVPVEGGHVETRRYDTLGIGFEAAQDGRVSAITLYPRVAGR
jgi:tRNA A-37 threonylcarbamoyl transferase component Bud32